MTFTCNPENYAQDNPQKQGDISKKLNAKNIGNYCQ